MLHVEPWRKLANIYYIANCLDAYCFFTIIKTDRGWVFNENNINFYIYETEEEAFIQANKFFIENNYLLLTEEQFKKYKILL